MLTAWLPRSASSYLQTPSFAVHSYQLKQLLFSLFPKSSQGVLQTVPAAWLPSEQEQVQRWLFATGGNSLRLTFFLTSHWEFPEEPVFQYFTSRQFAYYHN